jgi:hypothetical protein
MDSHAATDLTSDAEEDGPDCQRCLVARALPRDDVSKRGRFCCLIGCCRQRGWYERVHRSEA